MIDDLEGFPLTELSMPQEESSTQNAASLLRHWLISNIWPRGSFRLDQHQGFLTALMCFDSVIDEQSPFGAPNICMRA